MALAQAINKMDPEVWWFWFYEMVLYCTSPAAQKSTFIFNARLSSANVPLLWTWFFIYQFGTINVTFFLHGGRGSAIAPLGTSMDHLNPCYLKGIVHLIQDMASDDDFGPPDDGQTAILRKKNMQTSHFLCAKFSPTLAVLYLQLNQALVWSNRTAQRFNTTRMCEKLWHRTLVLQNFAVP